MIDGVDIATVPLNILRKKICILPQEATLFSGTIRENLDPKEKKSDEEMKSVLQLVNSSYTLDDAVIDGGDNFSLGEKQLICIARALLKGSKILIMDEATANIDIQTDKVIQEMVRKNFDNVTVVTVAHRLQTIMDANKVFVFDKGRLAENGQPLSLIKTESSIFNKLVQQSGCAEELRRMAKKKTLIMSSSSSKSKSNSSSNSEEQNKTPTPKVEVNLLTSQDSNRASPIVFQKTADRENSKQKLLASPKIGDKASSESSSD
ncbi:multidrug resistance-associated protein, putative [Entamoeba invadens IP1]|uniref:Multidrug resistance-associated protein, putative n=1 Tax=Entamoeba invadens IP1 TaxID=370355 RepID=A0A0A1U5D5_ENTIV|nr:multidrug resistance-associated protein, putative [Entamoeba invadens IP1]ELP86981.1 multidrug resistance-associated protein, putative [Entamoeba invadens IP1]|eukprot:XP_004253752.1 multidrug resistance-associated protein, putative [Entamoeba invadens IP1]